MNNLNSKTFAIGLLSLSAVVLFVANCLAPQHAAAQVTVKDRGYSVVTARVQSGGDGLYIVDNETGMMAVFTYNTSSRGIEARAVRQVADAFAQPQRR